MKTLFTMVNREFKLIFRDGISIFMAAAPAIMAIIFILVFGAARSSALKLAIDASADADIVQRLECIADIERFGNWEELRARVLKADSVAGVTMQNGKVTLIFEGDEGEDYINSIRAMIGMALAGETPQYVSETVEPKGSAVYDLSMASVLLMSLFVGGATAGLTVVSERENGTIRATAVSPMHLVSYILAKLIPTLLISIAGVTAAALIMGRGGDLPELLALALCSITGCGFFIFCVGAFAGNQLAAIGVLKLVMPLSLVLPLSSVFVRGTWQYLYYIFPTYWQFTALDAYGSKTSPVFAGFMALLVGAVWFGAVLWLFVKKTKFRAWR